MSENVTNLNCFYNSEKIKLYRLQSYNIGLMSSNYILGCYDVK